MEDDSSGNGEFGNRLEIKMVAPDKLKPHSKNPRLHADSALAALVQSLGDFGFTNPILVSQDNVIIAGHLRWRAAKRRGDKKVPVIYLPLKGAKLDAYLIADNRLHYDTLWDDDLLKGMIEEFKALGFDTQYTYFSDAEIGEILLGEDINPMQDDPSGIGIMVIKSDDKMGGGKEDDGEGLGGGDGGLGSGGKSEEGYEDMCPFCGAILLLNKRGDVIKAGEPSPDEEYQEDNEPEKGE